MKTAIVPIQSYSGDIQIYQNALAELHISKPLVPSVRDLTENRVKFITPSVQFNERERLSEYDVFSGEFNIFCGVPTFDALKDGNLTDLSCSLLNGRRPGCLWIGVSSEGMISGVSADLGRRDKFRQRMFKLMRSMFPKVMTDHFKMDFFSVRSAEYKQEKCLARVEFTPNGLMYSTPQKRCCVRECSDDNAIGLIKVLDCKAVVKRCLDHETRPYIRKGL